MRREAMPYAFTVVSLVLFVLTIPLPAAAGQLCDIFPMPCTFESPAFKFIGVDAETQAPLADVHALAEWQVHGPGGRLNGPLIVMDAVSLSDGVFAFPAWGPIEGPADGIGIGRDP